jgi:hypothetical protein
MTTIYRTAQQAAIVFPEKLHQLLEKAESSGNSHIISWLHDGQSFKVLDKERFVGEIMPLFFRTSNYNSFLRNLNLWGFKRLAKALGREDVSTPFSYGANLIFATR